MKSKIFWLGLMGVAAAAVSLTGCLGTQGSSSNLAPVAEAQWIKNGEPIVYDSKKWYPQDEVENLQDVEVASVGEYQGVEFFNEKVDVKPFARLYTKFATNRYRLYEKKPGDD